MNQQDRLSIRALALTGGVLWGASVLFVGLINLAVPSYGLTFLWFVSSVYPGYHAEPSFISVLIGAGYAVVDGLVCGAVFAWLYNFFAGLGKK